MALFSVYYCLLDGVRLTDRDGLTPTVIYCESPPSPPCLDAQPGAGRHRMGQAGTGQPSSDCERKNGCSGLIIALNIKAGLNLPRSMIVVLLIV